MSKIYATGKRKSAIAKVWIRSGKGRLSGKIGAIICESLEDKNAEIKQGKIFRIGSGMDDKMRENLPKIGTIISYKFSGVSKNGVPKHTRFWRIRDK